jgi:hypothetical protein
MVRIEIIANHSVEENILEAFSREGVGKFYTKYSNVFGVGNSGPRMGDAVWPEENFALIVWCEEDEARGIARAVAAVKKQFPDEGIRVFGIPAESGRFPHVMAAESVRSPVHAEARTVPPAAPVPAAPPPAPAPPPYAAPPPAAPAPPPYAAPPPAPAAPPYATPVPAAPAAPPYATPVPAAPAPPVLPAAGIGKEYDGQNMED